MKKRKNIDVPSERTEYFNLVDQMGEVVAGVPHTLKVEVVDIRKISSGQHSATISGSSQNMLAFAVDLIVQSLRAETQR